MYTQEFVTATVEDHRWEAARARFETYLEREFEGRNVSPRYVPSWMRRYRFPIPSFIVRVFRPASTV